MLLLLLRVRAGPRAGAGTGAGTGAGAGRYDGSTAGCKGVRVRPTPGRGGLSGAGLVLLGMWWMVWPLLRRDSLRLTNERDTGEVGDREGVPVLLECGLRLGKEGIDGQYTIG